MDKHLKNLEKELQETSKMLAIVSDTVDKISINLEDNKIQYGSRVLIKWIDGRTDEGRVWSIKSNGAYGINRDGYASTINLGVNRPGLFEHTLQNLSVGTYGKLEQEKWILTEKLSDLQKQIEQTIEQRVSGVKEDLASIKLNKADIEGIIKSKDFQKWFKSNIEKVNIPTIDSCSEVLISAIAREYIIQSENRQVYNLLIKSKI